MELSETLKNALWVEKYRPQKIEDCILPDDLKKTFRGFVDKGNIPNLLLHGGPGIGKTTVARAMLRELDADYIVVNGSLNGNIDTLRNEIKDFASSVSLFKSGRKYVILDEADYLNANSTQPSLRNFMEEYSKNCGFILTCNYKNRIIEPLHSRLVGVDFSSSPKEVDMLKLQFFKRLKFILENEGIEYDKNVLIELIKKHFPDMRRIINEVERYSANGKIDSGVLLNFMEENFSKLVNILKDKKFNEMRKWVAENSHLDTNDIIRKVYDSADGLLTPQSIAAIVVLAARYQYWAAFVVDSEINVTSFLTEFMVEAVWL
jgi:DNA polymerase III delta prime subunit